MSTSFITPGHVCAQAVTTQMYGDVSLASASLRHASATPLSAKRPLSASAKTLLNHAARQIAATNQTPAYAP
jgi:hypothetical protein